MAWDFALPPQDPGARLGHPGGLGNPDPPHQPPPLRRRRGRPGRAARAAQVALNERSWLQVIAGPTSAGRGSSRPPGRIASNSPTPDFVASPAGPAPALIGETECPRPPADPSPRRRTSRPCATTPRAPVPRGSRKELRTPADDRLSPYLAGPAADIRVGQALRVLLTATVLGRSVSFLTQIVEIATAREKLRRPVSGTCPPPPC